MEAMKAILQHKETVWPRTIEPFMVDFSVQFKLCPGVHFPLNISFQGVEKMYLCS